MPRRRRDAALTVVRVRAAPGSGIMLNPHLSFICAF
jgi:hypothetical protein